MNEDTVFFNQLRIPNQTINEVTYDSGDIFDGAFFDGIVGLGFDSLAERGDVPLMSNIRR